MVSGSSLLYLYIIGLEDGVDVHLNMLKAYDYLWEEELHHNYEEFSESKPSLECCKAELKKLQSLEKQVTMQTACILCIPYCVVVVQITSMPFVYNVGPLCLSTEPVKHFLEGLATRRKVKYASLLHERARVSITLYSMYLMMILIGITQ